MTEVGISVEGKVTLITGAAGGIGSCLARVFALKGAKLFLVDIKPRLLEQTANSILQKKGIVEILANDITRTESINRIVETAVKKFGRIDVLINNAGMNIPQPAEKVTEESWDKTMALNLKALFFITQRVGQVMIKQRKGKIINISSQAGLVALPLRSAYGASKGGVNQLTRVLALEWAPYNINVNAIAPTFVETPMTKPMFDDGSFKKYVLENIPLGRLAKPEDVAGAALYLASDVSDMVTGHILSVDGGWVAK